jgi:hypothetical protein
MATALESRAAGENGNKWQQLSTTVIEKNGGRRTVHSANCLASLGASAKGLLKVFELFLCPSRLSTAKRLHRKAQGRAAHPGLCANAPQQFTAKRLHQGKRRRWS